MRRAPFVMGATALGLVAVLSFHSKSPTTSLVLPAARAPGANARAGASQGSSGGHPPPSGGAGPVPGTTTTPSTTPVSQVRTATGRSEQYGYGVLAVKVTVTGTRITSVALSELQTADQYSQQLAVQVIPMLRSQVLAAQTARINGVSGATYTSEAYATSLQSALDKLHVA